MLGAIQSDSTGPGRPAEGRNATSPSGKGRTGGGEGGRRRVTGLRGLDAGIRGGREWGYKWKLKWPGSTSAQWRHI